MEKLNEWEMREALCEVGRRIWKREYVAANDGNFSVRLSEDVVLCTPTLVSKGFMKPEDLVLITPDGKHISGRLRMTSEIKMHLEIMRQRPEVRSVVHAHPPNATAFAVARHAIPKCVLPEIEVFIGEIPIVPYETPGTQIFADVIVPFLEHHTCFLLTNHGAVCVGKDPYEAYYRMETIEQYCRILILASQIGEWNRIGTDKIMDLLQIRQKLGYTDRRVAEKCELCDSGVPGEIGISPDEESQIVAEITRRVIERLGRS
jgi:L-fuculose-phosphate aldolase